MLSFPSLQEFLVSYLVAFLDIFKAVAYPEIFFGGGSTNSVDRGQREEGSGGSSPLVRGSAQFTNG
jgi:hypothetical protein